MQKCVKIILVISEIESSQLDEDSDGVVKNSSVQRSSLSLIALDEKSLLGARSPCSYEAMLTHL
jgi:hypothetical protein